MLFFRTVSNQETTPLGRRRFLDFLSGIFALAGDLSRQFGVSVLTCGDLALRHSEAGNQMAFRDHHDRPWADGTGLLAQATSGAGAAAYQWSAADHHQSRVGVRAGLEAEVTYLSLECDAGQRIDPGDADPYFFGAFRFDQGAFRARRGAGDVRAHQARLMHDFESWYDLSV